MFARSNCYIVTAVGWLAAATAAAQMPSSSAVAAPLPGTIAYGGPNALPYPVTSTPAPVYPTASTSMPLGGLEVASRADLATQMFPAPDLAAPAEVTPPSAGGDEPVVDLTITGDLCDADPPWCGPACWLGPAPWDTGIELGINGSNGTNRSLSIRTGGYIKRDSRFSRLDLSAYYNRTNTGGVATQNNAQLDVRNDWLLDDSSPWTLFATGNVFYDEFQAFDLQVNGHTGIGYRVVDDPWVSLIARCGAGTSREFGGPDEQWVPESMLGFEYDRRLTATQKLYGRLDYYPEWDEVGEYRLVADAGWEIELVQPSNLSLKISATDRYDSTPNGAEPHLVNYSVLLLLRL